MKTEKKPRNYDSSSEVERGTITSMLFSLFLVGLSLMFVMGFHQFLKRSTYVKKEASEEILTLDPSFKDTYIIIRNMSLGELYITDYPGKITEDSRSVMDGELFRVVKKGFYEGKNYYEIQDGTYIEADMLRVQELAQYIPMQGYVAITYISSSGVHLRSWVDFSADNIVKSVYIGDRVDVTAMVVTKDSQSAYRTDEGYYLTTDSNYFNDYTSLREKVGMSEEEMTEEDSVTTKGDRTEENPTQIQNQETKTTKKNIDNIIKED